MGGSSTTTHTEGSKLAGMSIQSSLLGQVIPIGWGRGRLSCNLIDYLNFKAIPHTKTTTTQSGKGFGSSSTQSDTTYTYSASIMLGICEGPITGIVTVYKDAATFSAPNALLNAGFSLANGSYAQTPWAYLTSLFPTHALAYRGLAYVYAQDYDLGTTGGVGNHSFEVDFTIQLGGGVVDADPKDIITDFLTNANYGVSGWIGGLTADWSDYSLYCRASNLLFSPVLDGQITASDFLTTLMDMSHSDCFFSEGLLKIKPFGDAAVTGNGVTWTPDLTPEFDLSEDDFNDEAHGGGEVVLEIQDQSDAYNQVSCEYLDRANEYAPAVVPAQDLDNILTYGARKQDVQQWHYICDAAVARAAIQLKLQRVLYVRDKYHFDLPMDYIGLEPMDLVTLTTTVDGMKLNRQLVRIESIDEDEDGTDVLHFVAEGLPFTAGAALYASTSGDGFRPTLNSDPGDTVLTQLFIPPSSLVQSATGLEVWIAAGSTNPAWGGCDVWVSINGTDYQRVGAINAPARFGQTSAAFALHADPDTVNTLSVDLTASGGDLTTVSLAQADAKVTLCLVGNPPLAELISYETATLTAAHKYDLTYIRRGLYGTPILDHTGFPRGFIRLDEAVFKLPFRPEDVGQSIFVKLPSFNIYGRQLQDLAGLGTAGTGLFPFVASPDLTAAGLGLAGGGTTWTGTNLSVLCAPVARAISYRFDFFKSDGTTLCRSITNATPSATLTAAMVALDANGPQRTYKISVTPINDAGAGPTSAQITVTNAAPAALSGVAASGGATTGTVSATASGDADLGGYVVFYSPTTGFDPATAGFVVTSGAPSLSIFGVAAATYFARMAAYDPWSLNPALLNLSAEVSFTITTGGGSTPSGGGTGNDGFGGLPRGGNYGSN